MNAVLERKRRQRTPTIVAEYDAAADAKRRISLRSTKSKYFRVSVLSDGTVLLQPQVLVRRDSISPRVMKMIDAAAENLKKGHASPPIDLRPFQED
ncbi:MAG: hypothetical protein ACLQU4_00150 [Limisphaerales bacterium]|jgi:hypothetical protein